MLITKIHNYNFGSDSSLDMDTLSCQHLLYITQHFISAEKKKP